MEVHGSKFKIRLGMFVAVGLGLFAIAIFIIGRQKNLFNPVFRLTSTFYNVSGLQVGNNIRFSGVTVGTVDNIVIINDSTVKVDMLVRKEVQLFIKKDCQVSIGSEGLIGDRLIVIAQGSSGSPVAKDGEHVLSTEPIEADAIMSSLQVTAGNSEIITQQLAEIMTNLNSGNGMLGRMIQDSVMANDLNETMHSLKRSSKGLDENMNAAQDNILLRGHFNRKAREAKRQKRIGEEDKAKQEKEKAR
jgi:phospholipid/cholesterol/gamma-HCH transport system substrate-binding protein